MILVDTSAWIEFFRGRDPIASAVDDALAHGDTALCGPFEDRTPFVYFYGLTPGVYEILLPCYATSWNAARLCCEIAVGREYEITQPVELKVADAPERRYSTAEAKVRLHQAEFRQLVIAAYDQRCAVSALPIRSLLDAAHIIPDRDERGRPEVSNGLCLSKLHHTAFDQQLLGISPDGIIHIAEQVLAEQDGPTLEHGLKAFHGQSIRRPRTEGHQPNRDYLAERFEAFCAIQGESRA